MRVKNIAALAISGLLLTTSLIVTPVGAVTVNPSRVQARCQLMESRIALITTRYENNKTKHVEAHQRIHDRVATFIAKLEGKGYDLTKIKADLATFDDMVKDINTQWAEFVTALNRTKEFECGNSNGQFVEAFLQAKQQLAEVRLATINARLYYQQTIKADIQALRAQSI